MWSLLLACVTPHPPPEDPLETAPWADEAAVAAVAAHWDHPVIEVPPFLITGDNPAFYPRAQQLVTWARDALRARHFPVDPKETWTIWLFAGDHSYRTHAARFFGDTPDTPYGYAAHHDLVMNFATGGGTLVHEMVHPFVAANHPDAPPWINEGLASLYEATRDDGGRMVPLVNWRLEGLAPAVAAGTAPRIGAVIGLDDAAFYGEDGGMNYAVARYVFLWLHDHDRLDAFWSTWGADPEADPTGAAALRAVVGDLDAFQPTWDTWVGTLGG